MDNFNRRDFMKSIAAAGALAGVPAKAAADGEGPVFLATWKHGLPAVNRAAEVFTREGAFWMPSKKGSISLKRTRR